MLTSSRGCKGLCTPFLLLSVSSRTLQISKSTPRALPLTVELDSSITARHYSTLPVASLAPPGPQGAAPGVGEAKGKRPWRESRGG